jgi:outer membrane lipoprotein-sorting protein
MKTNHAIALCTLIAASCSAMAGPEAGHPNIVAARQDAQAAIEKMKAAQVANEYDMNGHAAKAEEFLRKAEAQMRMAAEAANKKKK